MALFSFGKKDKKPPEVSGSVAKTQPTPPKIQTPPAGGTFPAVKLPQPTGLMPAAPMSPGTATTQPMAMSRTAMSGLKATRPGTAQSTRSTQRIILPNPPGSKPNSTKPLTMGAPGGRINLPAGMLLRCLPPEVLAAELSEFEANGTAAREIALPMHMILGQLPSGKVEMTFQDLIPHFPAGYLQPTEAIASYLPNIISLPLMDVVMRIPPDLLALRPDQKDVDAAVINMADPFTEEILRGQAEASHRHSQTNIIEESQAPNEEFVPRSQTETTRFVAPPPRPSADSLMPRLPGTTSAASASRSISIPGQVPTPIRSTTVMPVRPQDTGVFHREVPPSTESLAPVPPVPRHTGAIPTPPVPRHTTTLPAPPSSRSTGAIPPPPPPRHTSSLPPLNRTASLPTPIPAPAPQAPAPVEKPAAAVPEEPVSAEKTVAAVAAGAPDAGADALKRLAALAMTQLGDSAESTVKAASTPEPAATEAKSEEPAPAIQPRSIPSTEPPPIPKAPSETAREPAPSSAAAHSATPTASVAFNLNTCTEEDLVQNIADFSPDLARSIIEYRTKIGSFQRLEDLLEVPGITKAAYTNLTGEAPPNNRIPLSLNELLGFPAEQHISLKDVTERIACWPDVTGCVLSQSSGLSLVGTVPEGVDKSAVVAFAPRMFESINKSFLEVSGQETDALVIPSAGTSFHLFRNRDLYLIIMSRLPQMPERHMKVARFVLAALSIRRD